MLILNLEGPLLAFGGAKIDEIGTTLSFPPVSLIAGLMGNALGYDRAQWRELGHLQDRLSVASRIDHQGSLVTDYQTVDLTRVPGHHAFGKDDRGKHQRQRVFLEDWVVTVAVSVEAGTGPDAVDLSLALKAPARPLFIGRKNCVPSAPLYVATIDAGTLDGALSLHPRHARSGDGPLPALWPDVQGARPGRAHVVPGDRRDFANGVGVGRGHYLRGELTPPPPQEEVNRD